MRTKKRQILFGLSLGFLLTLCLALPAFAGGASVFISPGSKSFRVGDSFSIEVKVDTGGSAINASQAVIYFPTDKLEALSISKDNSIFTLWPEEPAFSNSSGEISFSGGRPHPGFNGRGNIITAYFKTKEEGAANFSLGRVSVLADDGKGTDILIFVREAKYSIQQSGPEEREAEPALFSATHPQQEEWYNNSSPEFQWKLASNINGVSFVLDRNSNTLPDAYSQGLIQSKLYKKIEDGVWYFHLRTKSKDQWGETSHYRIQIDSSPPEPFEIVVDNQGDSTNPNPKIYFETEDKASGINYYKVKVGEKSFLNLMSAQISPFPLTLQAPGQHPVIVRAMDWAGNGSEAKTVINLEPIESPEITVWPRSHVSGEETFYIEGTSLPGIDILIFLEKEGEKVKTWLSSSNSQGEWSFISKELIKPGNYYLSAQARDERGAVSELSEKGELEVSLSGFLLGPLMISFRALTFFLFLAFILGVIITLWFVFRNIRVKRILKKETREAREALYLGVDVLRKEIEKRIELMDSKPGFSQKEKKVCQELKKTLGAVEEFVEKEIRDIEKEL